MYQNNVKEQFGGVVDLSLNADNLAEFVVVRAKLSAPPVTSEDFTVTIVDLNDSSYDTVVYREDLSSPLFGTDVVYGEPQLLNNGKAVRVQYPNTDAATISVEIVLGEV